MSQYKNVKNLIMFEKRLKVLLTHESVILIQYVNQSFERI